jgi:twitching motility protein PilT
VTAQDGIVSDLLGVLWDQGGSDVHISVGSVPRLRYKGALHEATQIGVMDSARMEKILDSLLDEFQREELEDDREVDFSFTWNNKARIRANAYYQQSLPALALRMVPDRIPTPDELGLPQAVRDLIKLPQGLVLFTGPTGSGKSTSMAALIGEINRTKACHIITVEDPIEYVHRHAKAIVHQREIGNDATDWTRALRSALREDPDVLLVGEMRDLESISMTLTLAETGHLVFSTLHTNDAAQALDRMVDVFPGDRQAQIRMQLAGSLSAVIAQRLVRTKEGGLVAAFEVLMATNAVRNLIREGKTRQIRNMMVTGQQDGSCTLEMSLSRLVNAGVVTKEEAVKMAFVPAEIGQYR